ncbi:carbohydrate ABC transporter permease [Salipaludibacillus agaradhaerens]|uniref:Carbohydrate ABC transporter permease n=1 Tax=Salipaludibacillus agaradhaerens TaxID=76935 RepID=A0A9Q4B3V3_SALAG|nr:carbohydrate ABC transporter permease [Salipaludibacillus agaradhaerens]MCR6097821.1 carbohydrate ABC transporter permease [Salipaludibacillus agaradhaerens]MCR6116550.1 carbohydrate ABC transporter permease [Salipaludibacillus agaradhaerens]
MRKGMLYVLLSISGLALFFPIIYAFSVSFMTSDDILQRSLIPTNPTFQNYVDMFASVPIGHYLLNSFIVATVTTLGMLCVSALAAFIFAFVPFKGRGGVFILVISTLLIPWEATMIPNFLTIQSFGWMNHYLALTVPFFALAFGIFLLRQHFKTVPQELYEAAQVEGLSTFQIFYKVVIPYAKTSFVTLGIFGFLTTWNMYLWPLLVTTNDSVRTVQIGLRRLQADEVATNWGIVMAGVVIVILPTLILLMVGQKQLQKGLTKGALK